MLADFCYVWLAIRATRAIIADGAATSLWRFPYILAKLVVPQRNVRIKFLLHTLALHYIYYREACGASEKRKNQFFTTHASFTLHILSFGLQRSEKAPLLERRTRG